MICARLGDRRSLIRPSHCPSTGRTEVALAVYYCTVPSYVQLVHAVVRVVALVQMYCRKSRLSRLIETLARMNSRERLIEVPIFAGLDRAARRRGYTVLLRVVPAVP